MQYSNCVSKWDVAMKLQLEKKYIEVNFKFYFLEKDLH